MSKGKKKVKQMPPATVLWLLQATASGQKGKKRKEEKKRRKHKGYDITTVSPEVQQQQKKISSICWDKDVSS